MESKETSIEMLPVEMITEILGHLSFRDRKDRARCVCPHWRIILDNNPRFRFSFRPKLNNMRLEAFYNSDVQIDHVIMKNLSKPISELEEDWFPYTKSAELGNGNSEEHIAKLLRQGCVYMESLAISKYSLENMGQSALVAVLESTQWNNLKRLTIGVGLTQNTQNLPQEEKHLNNCSSFFKHAQIPFLGHLDVKFHLSDANGESRSQNLFLSFYEFLSHNANFLKRLDYSARIYGNEFIVPAIPQETCGPISTRLKLQFCSFRFSTKAGLAQLLPLEIIGSNLISFSIIQGSPTVNTYSSAMQNWIDQIFQSNRNCLKNVDLKMIKTHFAWLRDCSSLESLRVEEIGNEGIEASPLPQMKLRTLHCHTVGLENVIQQLVRDNATTLEDFRLHTSSLKSNLLIKIRLSQLDSLRILEIDYLTLNFRNQYQNQEFVNLKSFNFHFNPRELNGRDCQNFICHTMPGLVSLTIRGRLSLAYIEQLMKNLKNLKEMGLYVAKSGGIRQFCQRTKGLKVWQKEPKGTQNDIGKKDTKLWVIGINRRIFVQN